MYSINVDLANRTGDGTEKTVTLPLDSESIDSFSDYYVEDTDAPFLAPKYHKNYPLILLNIIAETMPDDIVDAFWKLPTSIRQDGILTNKNVVSCLTTNGAIESVLEDFDYPKDFKISDYYAVLGYNDGLKFFKTKTFFKNYILDSQGFTSDKILTQYFRTHWIKKWRKGNVYYKVYVDLDKAHLQVFSFQYRDYMGHDMEYLDIKDFPKGFNLDWLQDQIQNNHYFENHNPQNAYSLLKNDFIKRDNILSDPKLRDILYGTMYDDLYSSIYEDGMTNYQSQVEDIKENPSSYSDEEVSEAEEYLTLDTKEKIKVLQNKANQWTRKVMNCYLPRIGDYYSVDELYDLSKDGDYLRNIFSHYYIYA